MRRPLVLREQTPPAQGIGPHRREMKKCDYHHPPSCPAERLGYISNPLPDDDCRKERNTGCKSCLCSAGVKEQPECACRRSARGLFRFWIDRKRHYPGLPVVRLSKRSLCQTGADLPDRSREPVGCSKDMVEGRDETVCIGMVKDKGRDELNDVPAVAGNLRQYMVIHEQWH